jgi:1,2-diacylglycerol 3-alpha-glucosyltransferase
MRIAIASSGLGHVRRGIESWAEDLAGALRQAGQDVTLFQGGGRPTEPWRVSIACLQRFSPRNERLLKVFRRLGGWRYGMGSDYSIEQTTFAFSLWRKIRRDYDILHVQDPWLALVLDRLHRVGLSRPNVILGHGTEEDVSFLRKLSNLQHLTPMYDHDWQKHRPVGHFSTGIPNFIDTNRFCPGDKRAERVEWALPQDAFVVLSVAALKKTHKRCDYVIREFAEFQRVCPNAVLVLAGAREHETDEIMALAESVGNNSVRVFESVERDRLVSLYQSADVFVLGSLWEMFSIVAIEALSCGLPVICHKTTTLDWVVGGGGWTIDLQATHAMADALRSAELRRDLLATAASAARKGAVSEFGQLEVLARIVQMYHLVSTNNRDGGQGGPEHCLRHHSN